MAGKIAWRQGRSAGRRAHCRARPCGGAGNAVQMAADVSARVTALNRGMEFPRELDARYGKRITALTAARHNMVSRGLVARMNPGAGGVDVAIDPGGYFETSRPSTHADPGYGVDGAVHGDARHMPGHGACTTTSALNKPTEPFALNLANKG